MGDEVEVKASWIAKEFIPLWTSLWVVLPKGDVRKVKGGEEKIWRGRKGFVIAV